MNDHPRFEIVKQIGHGQFSNVFKAKWINAPIESLDNPSSKYSSMESTFNIAGNDHNLMQPFNCTGFNQLNSSCEQNLNSNNCILKDHHVNANHNNQDSTTNKNTTIRKAERYVALKEINFYDIPNSTSRMDCLKEVKLLQQLKHPNIINYNVSLIQDAKLFIVLELADGGDLSKLIKYYQKKGQIINERIILKYFTQVCSAVKYIHSKRILHRDIKPANIFMTSDGVVKLGDFGLGRFFSQNTRDAHSIVGTFYYMSPERIRESGYGFSSDVWSLGCVLYELITLYSPFCILNIGQQNNQFLAGVQQRDNDEVLHNQSPVHNNNPLQQQQQLGHHQQPSTLVNPPVRRMHQQQHLTPLYQQNPINLQWLIDRILRADYPSLAGYHEISPRLRRLTTECLNPNPDARPDMEYICGVVSEAYIIQHQISSTPRNSQDFTAMPCGL